MTVFLDGADATGPTPHMLGYEDVLWPFSTMGLPETVTRLLRTLLFKREGIVLSHGAIGKKTDCG
jgi:hypothetical protein